SVEERSDEAIQQIKPFGLLRFARNDRLCIDIHGFCLARQSQRRRRWRGGCVRKQQPPPAFGGTPF
ncbi:MAG: hypothetical protein FWC73_12475, partial [Defluviitaleaceae bacterium]|nr:hypothetical protein [Defluviitaleaceae bacterium]